MLTGSRNGRGDTSCRFSNEMSHDTSTQSTCLLAVHLLTSESLPESPNQVVVRTWLSRQEQPGNWSSAEQSYLRPKKREHVYIKEWIQFKVGWSKAEDEEGRTLLHMVASFTEASRPLWTQFLVQNRCPIRTKKDGVRYNCSHFYSYLQILFYRVY